MKKLLPIGALVVALAITPAQVEAGFWKPSFPKHGGSSNSVKINTSQTTLIGQSNTVSNTNVVGVNSNTGGNTIKGTTGGGAFIHSGENNTGVFISNKSGFNYLNYEGCCGGDIDVVINGNGGGEHHHDDDCDDPHPTPTPTPEPECEEVDVWANGVHDVMTGTLKNGSPITDPSRTSTSNATGSPDGAFYSIGKNGWIVLSFADPIVDGTGDDLSAHEVTNNRDVYPEEKALFEVSADGSTWYSVGTASNKDVGGVSYFDLGTTPLSEAHYVRLTDTTDYSLHGSDADGYDLDAVDAVSLVCEE